LRALDKSENSAIVFPAMRMKAKEEIIKDFNESLEDSIQDIAFKRLMLELLIDMRDALLRIKNV